MRTALGVVFGAASDALVCIGELRRLLYFLPLNNVLPPFRTCIKFSRSVDFCQGHGRQAGVQAGQHSSVQSRNALREGAVVCWGRDWPDLSESVSLLPTFSDLCLNLPGVVLAPIVHACIHSCTQMVPVSQEA